MVKKPPSGGPTIGPISAGMVSQDMASTSWFFGASRTRTSRAIGLIRAAPVPCRKRDSTKVRSELDRAQAMDPMTKTRIAQRKTRRAPSWSAIQPETGMKMAKATR